MKIFDCGTKVMRMRMRKCDKEDNNNDDGR